MTYYDVIRYNEETDSERLTAYNEAKRITDEMMKTHHSGKINIDNEVVKPTPQWGHIEKTSIKLDLSEVQELKEYVKTLEKRIQILEGNILKD